MTKIIAITGKIGSGKSTAAKYITSELEGYFDTTLEKMFDNYQYISLDDIANDLYDNKHVQNDLNNNFGVSTKIEIKKLKLNTNDLKTLSDIFLPYIIGYITCLSGFYVIEIPLLFENDMEYLCNVIINIDTSKKIRKHRIHEQLHKNFKLINCIQYSNNIRNERSDYIIKNNKTEQLFYNQLDEIIRKLK